MQSLTPLKEIYKDKFLIGNIYNEVKIGGTGGEILRRHFNVLTPENNMKPEETQKSEGVFTFDRVDAMLDFCKQNGMQTVGHTLTWHAQTPDWMKEDSGREKTVQKLKTHINMVAGRYSGKLLAWDVVNEAIADGAMLPADGNWKLCLRDSPWLRNIGDDYIELAFQFAQEADPHSKLYYNDYNLNIKNKAEVAAAMFADLKKKGIPIDGIGMQGHYSTTTFVDTTEQSINLFIEAGAEISITELDVTVNNPATSSITEVEEVVQAQIYAELFQVFNRYADAIERVTFWGYDDAHSWRKEKHPCLFDRDYTPKEAYYAVADPDGYLQKNPIKAEAEAKILEAAYGTPSIDEKEDGSWAAAMEAAVNTMTMAWQGAKGTVKALWDESNLYVLVKVQDSMINTDSTKAYEQDSVEVFVDENNGKTGYYEEDDNQYRVSCRNIVSFGNGGSREGFASTVSMTEDGYLVKMKIPMKTALAKDMNLGFDVQINDSNEHGERISVARFNDDTDNSWQSTEHWGILKLR